MSAAKLAGRAVLVSALSVTLVPLLGANPAYACSCIGGTEQEQYDRADVVFEGTMDDRDTSTQSGRRVFVLHPVRAHKGTVTVPQKLSSNLQGTACGLMLTGSGPFLVFAHNAGDNHPGDLASSSCSGTRSIKSGEEPAFRIRNAGVVATAASPADANTTDTDWAPIAAGAAALAAAAMIGTAWVARRRRT